MVTAPLQFIRAEARLIRGITPDPELVVFGSARNVFSDNAAHLFLAMSANSTMRCVWISGSRRLVERLRSMGLQAEHRWSLRGITTCVRAGWVVVSFYTRDVHVVLGRRALVLNLWHGLPLKRLGDDISTDPVVRLQPSMRAGTLRRWFTWDLRPPDFVLSTTPTVSRHFATAFRVPEDRCIELGYPRCDLLFETPRPPSPLLVQRGDIWQRLRRAQFVVGYFPTWRDDGKDFITDAGLSLRALADTVHQEGGAFVCKLHPLTARTPDADGVCLLEPDDDLTSFLPLCTLLITDYSSVAFDFLLLDRPIIYYVPDMTDYDSMRGFYFGAEEAMPGPLVGNADELLRSVREAIRSGFRVSEGAAAVRTRFWGDYSGEAAQRIARFIRDGPRVDAHEDHGRPPQ